MLIMSISGIKNLGAHVVVSEMDMGMIRFIRDELLFWALACRALTRVRASIQSSGQGCELAQIHAYYLTAPGRRCKKLQANSARG